MTPPLIHFNLTKLRTQLAGRGSPGPRGGQPPRREREEGRGRRGEGGGEREEGEGGESGHLHGLEPCNATAIAAS